MNSEIKNGHLFITCTRAEVPLLQCKLGAIAQKYPAAGHLLSQFNAQKTNEAQRVFRLYGEYTKSVLELLGAKNLIE